MFPARITAFREVPTTARPADGLARACLLCWVGLLPLTMWIGFADTVETPKRLELAALSSVLLAVTLADPAARRRLGAHPMSLPLAGLLAATLAVSGTGQGWIGEEGSWAGGASLAALWAGALGAAAWGGRGAGRAVAATLVAAGLLAAGYEAVQAAGLDPVPWDPGRRSSYWLMATLGNPVHLAAFLAGAFWATFAPGGRCPWWVWVIRAALVAGALATRQRSALLALAGGAVAWGWLARGSRSVRGGAALRADAAWPAAAASSAALGPGLRLFDLWHAGSRPEIWAAAARMWRERPLAGVGPDCFHAWFPAVASYGFFVADPPVVSGGNVFLRLPASAHNELLGMAASGGVLLLGGYVWALVAGARAASRSRLLPAAVCMWCVQMVNPPSAATGSIAWLLLVLAAAEGAAPAPDEPDARTGRSSRWPVVAALAVALAALSSALTTAVVESHRREAGRLAFVGDSPALGAELRRWGDRAARGRPAQALSDAALWRARWEADPRDTDALARASALLARARRDSPRYLFALTASADLDRIRGRLARDRGALRDAEAELRDAIGLAPAVASLWGDLAEVLELEGKTAEAARARAERARRDPLGIFGLPATDPSASPTR